MIRPELHRVRRPMFDCTSYRRPLNEQMTNAVDESLHLHAELVRPLPQQPIRYSDIKIALRLAA